MLGGSATKDTNCRCSQTACSSRRRSRLACHGCQTLRQLFPNQIESRLKVEGVEWSAPVVKIVDKPQFVWRGLMLDPARHFIGKQGILRCLDWMAYHKLNRLHLHLTDTEGWRVEIEKYPRLTEFGAWADLGEGVKIGGFYTQDDIREIVAYATERFITIVPRSTSLSRRSGDGGIS